MTFKSYVHHLQAPISTIPTHNYLHQSYFLHNFSTGHFPVQCSFLLGRIECTLRPSSDLAGQAKRPNPKLLSKAEDRSPLKYIISVLLSDYEYFIEKKFGFSIRVWVSVLEGPKFLSRGQTLDAKSAKKRCHVGTL